MNKIEITSESPTNILIDFEKFIELLETFKITLTEKAQNLPIKALVEIDKEMSSPLNFPKGKAQESYPLLNLFFNFVVEGNLFQRNYDGKKYYLKATEYLEKFKDLSDTEKYFYLLEIFWCKLDWKEIYKDRIVDIALSFNLKFIKDLLNLNKNEVLEIKLDDNYYPTKYLKVLINYFESFGITKVDIKEEENSSKIITKLVSLTEIGKVICDVFINERPFEEYNFPYLKHLESPDNQSLIEIFNQIYSKNNSKIASIKKIKNKNKDIKPDFLSAFQKSFNNNQPLNSISVVKNNVDGYYRFKVVLGKASCEIGINGENDLVTLHIAIQDAFNFDNDHLYSFFMDGKKWSNNRYVSPMDDDGECVSEVKIRDLNLILGQRFIYLFDYGAEWIFNITLESINEKYKSKSKYEIYDMKGKVPRQYDY